MKALNEVLVCRIMIVETDFNSTNPILDQLMCAPVWGGNVSSLLYHIELPLDFLNKTRDRLRKGDREISIEGGEIIDNEVFIPEHAGITLNPIRKTVINRSTSRKMLIVRVTTSDADPTLSSVEMNEKTFGDKTMTLSSQYFACSHGKLKFDPAPSQPGKIVNGVMQVTLDMKARGSSRIALANAAVIAAEEVLGGKIGDVVDNAMICLPPGTLGDWTGFATVNGVYSVYNDLSCGYISMTMHEVGHNLGFQHAFKKAIEYADLTSYMGSSYEVGNWPSICFNAVNHWDIGWYSDRRITLDLNKDRTWKGWITSFVDYDLTDKGDYILIRIGNLILQYNDAKGMNSQSREMRNQLTVVRSMEGASDLLQGLDVSDQYSQKKFGNKDETLIIRVCGLNNGDDGNKMRLSIGFDSVDCEFPPTAAPSWKPPDRGQYCDDNFDRLFDAGNNLGNRGCLWLQNNPNMKNELCVPSNEAYNICPETCGKCSDGCSDDSGSFTYDGDTTSCQELRQRYSSWSTFCRQGQAPFARCKEMCNSCQSSIDNAINCVDREGLFPVPGEGDRTCVWLAQPSQEAFRQLLCRPSNAWFHRCPETCGKCFDWCSDDQSAKFDYKGVQRSCLWLWTRPSLWDDACKISVIKTNCRETCGNC
jgi:hypothetical protein